MAVSMDERSPPRRKYDGGWFLGRIPIAEYRSLARARNIDSTSAGETESGWVPNIRIVDKLEG